MTSPAMKRLIKNCQKQLELARAKDAKTAHSKTFVSPTVRGNKKNLAPEREGHSGRRGDILAEYRTSTGKYAGAGEAEGAAPPLMIKISIAGSGCAVMSSQKGKKDKTLLRMNDKLFDRYLLHWQGAPEAYGNKKGDVTFSGPGGASTPNKATLGSLDRGANKIDKLIEKVPQVIKATLPKGYETGKNVIVIIKAHSRGADAATQISNDLKHDFSEITVELTAFDPVPGPGQEGEKLKVDIGQLDQSTLIYSVASGYGSTAAFAPQKVSSAKRIIISQQVHAGGVRKGYRFNGKTYKGSALNSLPLGAYYETKVVESGTDAGVGIIAPMTKDDFLEKLELTTEERASKLGVDAGRFKTLRKALDKFFANNGG